MCLDLQVRIVAFHQAQRQRAFGRVAFDDHGTHQCQGDPALPFIHSNLRNMDQYFDDVYIEYNEIGRLTRVPVGMAKAVHILKEAEDTLQNAVRCAIMLHRRLHTRVASRVNESFGGSDIVVLPSLRSRQDALLRWNR